MSASNAVFLDGLSLAEQRVAVALRERELVITSLSGEALRTWSLEQLHVDAMQEGHVYHLSHATAPHEELLLRDAELGAQVLALARRVAVLPGGANKLRYGLLLLGALLAAMACAYFAAPKVSLFVARRIPLVQERVLGGQLEFLLRFDECRDDPARDTLKELVAELVEARGSSAREQNNDHPDVSYDVHITSSPVPNAFALPGGIILVTRGFLKEAEGPEEIAGVLAHEVEHIEQRHVLAGALRGALLTALWSITVGDYSGLMAVDPSTAYRIVNLGFSREDEQAADDGAVVRLHRAGYSHRGLAAFFKRMMKTHGDFGPAWLSTHPSTEARVGALDEAHDVTAPRSPLDATRMQQLRSACTR